MIPDGNWENGRNILARNREVKVFCDDRDLKQEKFSFILKKATQKLLEARNNRARPGLDNKIIVAWNGLMIGGLADAYLAFRDKSFLDLAENTASFILQNKKDDGTLPRTVSKDEKFIPGFLDDYTCMAEACLALYRVTFDEKWIHEARQIMDYALEHFYDLEEKLFFYTASNSDNLIARKKELFDNVIPGSNSMAAKCYFRLGSLLDNEAYLSVANGMMSIVKKMMIAEPEYLYNWGILYGMLSGPFAEIVITGNEYLDFGLDLEKDFHPGKLVMASREKSDLPLFEGRKPAKGKTTVFVCYNKSCRLPVYSVGEALSMLE